MKQATINKKTKEINIEGKVYMNITECVQEFYFDNNSQIYNLIQEGMPCIKLAGRWWFNKEDCHKWFAGEK